MAAGETRFSPGPTADQSDSQSQIDSRALERRSGRADGSPWRAGPSARVVTVGSAEADGATGVHADLQVIAAMRAFGAAVTTSVYAPACDGAPATMTTEATGSIPSERMALSSGMIGRQLRTALDEVGGRAAKVGFLPSSDAVDVVVDLLSQQVPAPLLVVEAACVGRDGGLLIDADVVANLKRRLIVGSAILVAGIRDAEILAGMAINTLEDKRHAALMLRTIGAETVVLVDAMALGDRVTDFVAGTAHDDAQDEFEEVMDYPRPGGWRVRGITGAMATASAVGLARGLAPIEAVRLARTYVAEAVRLARATGGGSHDVMECPPYFPV
jgi:hydroxymethylpyrimidine kinase/phosphomethylpyrimidine kinase